MITLSLSIFHEPHYQQAKILGRPCHAAKKFPFALASATLILSNCSFDKDKKADPIVIPPIAPIVADATPEALKPGSSLLLNHKGSGLVDINADAAAYIEGLFKNTYSGISGVSGQGYINVQLMDLDSRLAEMSSRSGEAETGRACWQNSPNDYTATAASINPILTLDMKVNCHDKFDGSDASGSGSGLVFGKDAEEKDFYAWLTLYQQNGQDVFAYFGGVRNAESETDKEVDYMFLENFPQYNRVSATRLYAKPSTNTFELHYASGEPNLTSPDATLNATVGCGLKMISDGTYIYASGKAPTSDVTVSPQFDCATEAQAFEVCLSATDLSSVDSSSCGIGASGGLDESFRFDSSADLFDAADVKASTAPEAVNQAVSISNVDALTTDFNIDAEPAE